MQYGLDMTIADVQSDQKALALFNHVLPGLLEKVGSNPQAANLSIRKFAAYMRGMIPEKALAALEKGLQQIGAENEGLSEAEQVRIAQYRQLAEQVEADAVAKRSRPEQFDRDCFTPGQIWLDTQGERIQAHGGAIWYEDGVYYWYGENKQFTDGKSRIWHWGVRAYQSMDLYNWTDLGLIISPVLDDPDSNLFPESRMTRPHIVRSEATGKYICWLVVAGNDACFTVLESPRFLGPYTLIKEHYRPFGRQYSDFDIVVDEDGVGWMYVDVDHSSTFGFRLSADLTSIEEQISVSYEGLHPPFCREAASVFSCNGKKYMLSSGMSGYLPNPSDLAVSTSWKAPFISVGDPFGNDESHASFNSQVSQVFSVPGRKDAFIVLADRWNGNFLMDAHRVDVATRVIASHYAPGKYTVTPEERAEYQTYPSLHETDTSKADYVWLPMSPEENQVRIEWQDRWKWETLGTADSDDNRDAQSNQNKSARRKRDE